MTTPIENARVNEGYYTAPEIVERFDEKTASGLTRREARIVDRYFRPGGRVLDLGCGTGRATWPLDERGFDVIGIDVSRPMVRRARERYPELPFVACDARSLPFEADAVDDVLFSFNGIDYLPDEADRRRALREVRRVLRPGGTFAFSTHNVLNRFVATSLDQLRSRLEFWWLNVADRRLRSSYKLQCDSQGVKATFFGTPWRQRRELRETGFEVLAVVQRDGLASRWFGPSLYFVATVG